ncbi:XK-related protein, partial [Caligus rogercresseyi]
GFILGGSLLAMIVLVHNCPSCFRFNPEAISPRIISHSSFCPSLESPLVYPLSS